MNEAFAIELLVAAFAGGAFGAAIGALPAFAFTGVLVIVGETLAIARRSIAPEAALPPITEAIAFGVVFGPHVSFAGGAAAAAYAAKRGYLTGPFPYHPAKYVTGGLGTRPDVLLVGGAFGVLGHAVASGSLAFGGPWDPIAMGVVLSAFAHRAVFGYDLVGTVRTGGWLDVTVPRGTDPSTDGGRPIVEPWLPHQCRWRDVTSIGVIVGILGAYLAYLTGSAFLAFGIAAATLVYTNAGVDRIPITHHIALPASTVTLALAGGSSDPAAIAVAVPLGIALLAGAAFGVFGALVGELAQRLLYAHAETHLDPPAASIVVTTLAIALLAWAGVLETTVWIPHP